MANIYPYQHHILYFTPVLNVFQESFFKLRKRDPVQANAGSAAKMGRLLVQQFVCSIVIDLSPDRDFSNVIHLPDKIRQSAIMGTPRGQV